MMQRTKESAELTFDAEDLVARVASLDAPALDSLPFGVVRLDRDGKVTFFSRAEAKQSGFGDRPALGRTFFTEIAPCMGSPELLRRIESARDAGTLDILFEQVGDFEDATRELRVRIKSATKGELWVFIERRS
ncbi:MAG: PAS domain-containing protein [Myxococcales bacterium]